MIFLRLNGNATHVQHYISRSALGRLLLSLVRRRHPPVNRSDKFSSSWVLASKAPRTCGECRQVPLALTISLDL